MLEVYAWCLTLPQCKALRYPSLFFFHNLVARKNERSCWFSKRIFKDEKQLKDFSVDRLSQMTLILDNSLLSQKDKLSGKIKWGHMNVYIFNWKHSQSNVFFLFLFELFYFTFCLWHPHQMCVILDININIFHLNLVFTSFFLTFSFQFIYCVFSLVFF